MQTMILSYGDQSKRLSAYTSYPSFPNTFTTGRSSYRTTSGSGNGNGKRPLRRLESLPEVESTSNESTTKTYTTQLTRPAERMNPTYRGLQAEFSVTALLQSDEVVDRFHRSGPAEQPPSLAASHHGGQPRSPHYSQKRGNSEEQCLPGTIDRYVDAVQSMNDTVLLPSRLIAEIETPANGNGNGPSQNAASKGQNVNCSEACVCECHEESRSGAAESSESEMDKYSTFMLLNVVSHQLQRSFGASANGFSRNDDGHDRQLALLNQPLSSVDERAVAKAKQICSQIEALQKTISELTRAAHQVKADYNAQTNPDRRQ